MDFKPYPTYKDSGVPWLGEVPAHWTVKRGKALFHSVDVRSSAGEEELLTVSSERGVIPRSSATVTMFKAASYVGYKLCWPGDLVINSLWAWGRGLGVSRHHGIISSAYGVYRLRPPYTGYSAYIHELVRSPPFNWELQIRSKGIWISRLQLTDEAFLGAPFPLPPSQEQAAIVRYLDHADRRIRRYIRAKQKLIKLLEEQKQAIIHQAVTGKVDIRTGQPHPAYKPSAVRWLGNNIPEHWEVWQIGHLGRVGNGSTPSRGNMGYWDGGTYPWLNSSSVNHSPIMQADQFVTDLALRECHLPQIQPGSVLVAITGQGKTRGTSAVLDTEATINQHVACVTTRNDVIGAEYLQLALLAAYRELRAISDDSGSTKGALTCWDISHFRVPLPPRAEQAEIVLATRQATKTLESASGKAAQEVMLAREYRIRLIADVVTGKLDVREAASRLPEVEAPKPLEETDALTDTDNREAAPEEAAV